MDEKPPENILETLLKAAFEKVWCLKSEDKLRKKERKIEKYTKFRTIYLHSPLLKQIQQGQIVQRDITA